MLPLYNVKQLHHSNKVLGLTHGQTNVVCMSARVIPRFSGVAHNQLEALNCHLVCMCSVYEVGKITDG